MTVRFPDVVAAMKRAFTKTSCVIDAEIVAYDPQTKHMGTFQQLQTRPRREVKIEDITVPVVVLAFDMMYLDGESLLSVPFRARSEKMRASFVKTEGVFEFVQCKVFDPSASGEFAW